MSGARIRATSAVPSQSIDGERFGSFDSVIVFSVTGMQTAAMAASIQNKPCQPVESTSRPADERTGGGPDRRSRAPQRHGPQPLVAVGGQGEEAQAAGQDRGAGRALDAATEDHAEPGGRTARSARTSR